MQIDDTQAQKYPNHQCGHKFKMRLVNGFHVYCSQCKWCWTCNRYIEIGV